MTTRKQIRTSMRSMRRSLPPAFLSQASLSLKQQLIALPELRCANKVALYLANDGELDPYATIRWLWEAGIQTFIPVLHPFAKGQLLFLRFTEDTELVTNRYGIAQPKLDIRDICPVAQLDIIFTPLVAFDHQGQRLGMGGGYYDRTLAPFTGCLNPIAIGLAYDEQQLTSLPTEAWDIPLSKIVTPTRVLHGKNHDVND
nr:5-formyltetrahydrofolate cyclo-ligase [Vibrio gallicus]